MCKTLKVSTSGFCDWCQRPLSQRQQANVALTAQIREAFFASDETYGMQRIRVQLQGAGMVASRKRIARLMRLAQIRGVSRRRSFCVTTERDVRHRLAPDLVKREFVATDINQLWVADMTYIPTWAGFLYLSVVIDVYSRKVVGWAFGERMTSDLVILALNMALMTRKLQSVIRHSEQGSQYTSIYLWQPLAKEMVVCPSMGTVGDAYDNAMAEGFFASLEGEPIARRILKTKTEARLTVFTWIESWYSPRRGIQVGTTSPPKTSRGSIRKKRSTQKTRSFKSFYEKAQNVRGNGSSPTPVIGFASNVTLVPNKLLVQALGCGTNWVFPKATGRE